MCLCLQSRQLTYFPNGKFSLTRWSRAWKFAGDTWLITKETVDSSFRLKWWQWLLKFGKKANDNELSALNEIFQLRSRCQWTAGWVTTHCDVRQEARGLHYDISGVGSVYKVFKIFVHQRIPFANNSVQTQEKSYVNYFNPNAIGQMPEQNGKLSISLRLNPLTSFILFYFTYVLSWGKNSTHQHFCVMKLKENLATWAQLFEGRLALTQG